MYKGGALNKTSTKLDIELIGTAKNARVVITPPLVSPKTFAITTGKQLNWPPSHRYEIQTQIMYRVGDWRVK